MASYKQERELTSKKIKRGKGEKISKATKSRPAPKMKRDPRIEKWEENYSEEGFSRIDEAQSILNVEGVKEQYKKFLHLTRLYAPNLTVETALQRFEEQMVRKGYDTDPVTLLLNEKNLKNLATVYASGWGLPHINVAVRDTQSYWFKRYEHNKVKTGIAYRKCVMVLYCKLGKNESLIYNLKKWPTVAIADAHGLFDYIKQKTNSWAFGKTVDHVKSKVKVGVKYIIDGIKNMYDTIKTLLTVYIPEGMHEFAASLVISIMAGLIIRSIMWYYYRKKQTYVIITAGVDEMVDPEVILAQAHVGESEEGFFARMGALISHYAGYASSFNMESWLNHFGKHAHSFNSISSMIEKMIKIGKEGLDWLWERVTGQPFFDESKHKFDLKLKMERLEALAILCKTGMKRDQATEITDIVRYLIDVSVKARYGRMDYAISRAVTDCLLRNHLLYEEASAFACSGQLRFETIGVHLIGKPGVGKTTIKDALIQILNDQVYEEDFDRALIYDRKSENEYWDGYKGNRFCVMDDFLQVQDAKQRMLSALEYIYAVNRNPYQLHMAGIEDKKTTYFVSDWLISTGNYNGEFLPADLQITDYQALYRRMHFTYLVTPTKKGFDKKQTPTLKSIIEGVAFTRINTATGKLEGKPKNLIQIVDELAEEYQRRFYMEDIDFTNGYDELYDEYVTQAVETTEMPQVDKKTEIQTKLRQKRAQKERNEKRELPRKRPWRKEEKETTWKEKDKMEKVEEVVKVKKIEKADDGSGVFAKDQKTVNIYDDIGDDEDEDEDEEEEEEENEEQDNVVVEAHCKLCFTDDKFGCDDCKWLEQMGANGGTTYIVKCPSCFIKCPDKFLYRHKMRWARAKLLHMKWPQMFKEWKVESPLINLKDAKLLECPLCEFEIDMGPFYEKHNVEYIKRHFSGYNLKWEQPVWDYETMKVYGYQNFALPDSHSGTDQKMDLGDDQELKKRKKSKPEKEKMPEIDEKDYALVLTEYTSLKTMDEKKAYVVEIQNAEIRALMIQKYKDEIKEWQDTWTSCVHPQYEKQMKARKIQLGAIQHIASKMKLHQLFATSKKVQQQDILDEVSDDEVEEKIPKVKCLICEEEVEDNGKHPLTLENHFEMKIPGVINDFEKIGPELFGDGKISRFLFWRQKTVFARYLDTLKSGVLNAKILEQMVRYMLDTNFKTPMAQLMRMSGLKVRLFSNENNRKHFELEFMVRDPVEMCKLLKYLTLEDGDELFNTHVAMYNGGQSGQILPNPSWVTKWKYNTFTEETEMIGEKGGMEPGPNRMNVVLENESDNKLNLLAKLIGGFALLLATAFILCALIKLITSIVQESVIGHSDPHGYQEKMLIKNVRKKQIKQKTIDAHMSDQFENGCRRVCENVVQFKLIYENGSEFVQFMTFVDSNVAFTTAHAFKLFPIKHLQLCWARSRDYENGTVIVSPSQYKLKFFEDRDLVRLEIEGLPPFKSLERHIPYKAERCLPVYQNPAKIDFTQEGLPITVMAPTCKSIKNLRTQVTARGVVTHTEIPNAFVVEGIKSMKGDCGLPYMLDNNQIPHRFMGIHVAGSSSFSYFVPVFKEDLVQTEAHMGEIQIPKGSAIKVEDEQPPAIKGLKAIGSINTTYFMSSKAEHKATPLQLGTMINGEMVKQPYPVEKIPAKLKPYYENEKKIDPLQNGLKRLEGRMSPEMPSLTDLEFDECMKGVVHQHFDWNQVEEISLEEAVRGIPGEERIGPIDRTSSSAFGFSDRQIKSEDLFPLDKEGKVQICSEIRELVEREEKMVEKGELPPAVFLLTKKSELKEVGKENKPRIFCNGPKSLLLRSKMVFAKFFSQVMNHGGTGDVYIGINPMGPEWRMLYEKMQRINTEAIADDTAAWDFNVRFWFTTLFIKYLRRNISNRKLLQRMEAVLMTTFCPYVIIGKFIYQFIGMPSGSYLTAVMNSIYNSFMTRFCWMKLNPGVPFDANCSLATFGDDLLLAVIKEMMKNFNGITFAMLCKKYFNIVKTPITKDGTELVRAYQLEASTWEEGKAQFLKRMFRVHDGFVYPILDKKSIYGMLNWYKPIKERPDKYSIVENVETALREIAYYGKEEFDKECRVLVPYVRTMLPNYVLPFTYETQVLGLL